MILLWLLFQITFLRLLDALVIDVVVVWNWNRTELDDLSFPC